MRPFKSILALIFISCTFVGAFAQRPAPETEIKTAKIEISVFKGYNGKPVKNASVILHAVTAKGEQEQGGFQLKTTTEGIATIDEVPYGKVRIQVIVPGFKTYGEDFDISEPEKSVTVRLEEPKGQYSVY